MISSLHHNSAGMRSSRWIHRAANLASRLMLMVPGDIDLRLIWNPVRYFVLADPSISPHWKRTKYSIASGQRVNGYRVIHLLAYRSLVSELGYIKLKVPPLHQILLFQSLRDLLNTVPLTGTPLHRQFTSDGPAYTAVSYQDCLGVSRTPHP
ncbi:hypothetical protein BGY98DRAFT_302067 [Russula aff. rugulosa BPL654]|nr:hypothetical protein BGY98DRAFT_302067 [Russula aff. rugulosa BPL654]